MSGQFEFDFDRHPTSTTQHLLSPDRYHNTTGLQGQALQAREMRTESQGRKILDYFRKHPGRLFTPFEVQHGLNLLNVPITSIRRSMTNLTKCEEAYLIKTGIRRPGDYGDDNFCWVLSKTANQDSYTLTLTER